MRELKFRALNTDLANPVMEYFTIDEPYKFIRLKGKQFKQYTGLKDKNGVEIYEGDILKTRLPVEITDNSLPSLDYETIHCEVLFENGCFMAKGNTVEYPWVLDGDKTILHWLTAINAYGNYPATCEVIGNIYANPELLES